MTSKTSFCNPALLRKNLTRCWPLWTFYTVALLLTVFLPLNALRALNAYTDSAALAGPSRITQYYLSAGLWTQLSYAILSAGFCFGYLNKTRSAYMLHAFPVTRGVLFRTNLVSGLLFSLAPWLVLTLLNALVLLPAYGWAALAALAKGYAVVTLEYLFLFGLAVLCMHTAGKLVNAVLRYCILNFAAVLLTFLLELLLEPLLYGCTLTLGFAEYLSPVVLLTERVLFGGDATERMIWLYLGAIALGGVLMLALAWLLYRKRQLENCGEAVAFPFLRPVFKYALALAGALCIGLLAAGVTYGTVYLNRRILPTLIFLLLGGFFGYFGAEMMLKRSARVFRGRAWLGFGCFALAVVLGLSAVRFDVFGVVRRVPETEEIASLEYAEDYYSGSITLTSPEDIDAMREIHGALIAAFEAGAVDSTRPYAQRLRLTYRLRDGSTLERTYNFSGYDIDSAARQQLQALSSRPDLNTAYFAGLHIENSAAVMLSGKEIDSRALNTDEIRALSEVIVRDAQEGNLRAFADKDSLYGLWVTPPRTDSSAAEFYLPIPQEAQNTVRYLQSLT